MVLHQTQKIVAKDDHDYRVVCCGRQWGKTTLAVQEMLACAYAKSDRKIVYFATTIDQARDIAWATLKHTTQAAWSKQPNESRLELGIKTQDGGISEIFLDGFENIETARGKQFDMVIVDEVAYLRNWKYAWEQILEPTLAFRKGKALFISTPQGYNHFYEMYENGQQDNPYWKSWRFPSSDNPFLPPERIEQARKNSTDDAFATEYLADFRKHTGLIYKDFDPSYHVIEPFEIPEEWEIFCGIDFGDVHPFACLWIATDGEYNFWIIDEVYGSNLRLDEVAGMYNSNKYRQRVVSAWCDPSRPDWIKEFEWRKVYMTIANKSVNQERQSWVNFGIEKVAERLKPTLGRKILTAPANLFSDEHKWNKGLPSLFVFNTCVNTIKEFGLYKWKQNREGSEMQPVPDKINDDALDALRYFMVSYRKSVAFVEKASDISNANWSLDMQAPGPAEAEQDWTLSG